MSPSYAPPLDVTSPSTSPVTSDDLAAVVQRGIDPKRRHKIKTPTWPSRTAHEVEAVVGHLINHPLSVTRVAVWGLEHGGLHSVEEIRKGTGLSTRSVKSANKVLLGQHMASFVDERSRAGYRRLWTYSGVPLRDLSDDLGSVQKPRSNGSWECASLPTVTGDGFPEFAHSQDHGNLPVACGHDPESGVQEGPRIVSTRDVDRRPVSVEGCSSGESRESQTGFLGRADVLAYVARPGQPTLADDELPWVISARQLLSYLGELLARRGMTIQPNWKSRFLTLFESILIEHDDQEHRIAWALEEAAVRLDKPYLYHLVADVVHDALGRHPLTASMGARMKWLENQADQHGTRALLDSVLNPNDPTGRSSWSDRIDPPVVVIEPKLNRNATSPAVAAKVAAIKAAIA